jgi:hypothetical protein
MTFGPFKMGGGDLEKFKRDRKETLETREAVAECGDVHHTAAAAGSRMAKWLEHNPPAEGQNADTSADDKTSVNARMIDILQRDATAAEWTIREWATRLKESKSTIGDQPAWKAIMRERESRKWDHGH